MTLQINNQTARRLWLESQGLATTPTGRLDVVQIIRDLGFVQLDTIRNVVRAHDHILWSRNQNYRESMLDNLLAAKKFLFEHFTHDASVLPMDFYPMWKRQFRRLGERARRSAAYSVKWDASDLAAIKARIKQEGPLSTHAFDTKVIGAKPMWVRPPHKRALDHMWYCGDLATSHRQNFIKFYDLPERVIPAAIARQEYPDEDQIDWLCRSALDRLAFGTLGDIQRFWAAADGDEVRGWRKRVEPELVSVEIERATGNWSSAVAPCDIERRIAETKAPTARLRIINPFDPAVRDRARLLHLFGIEYKVEIFVPPAKRQWGYYVYLLLEGDRFVGRIELRADRKAKVLNVLQIWREPNTRWTARRSEKLERELLRLARLAGADTVEWACARLPE